MPAVGKETDRFAPVRPVVLPAHGAVVGVRVSEHVAVLADVQLKVAVPPAVTVMLSLVLVIPFGIRLDVATGAVTVTITSSGVGAANPAAGVQESL